jgi:hypothetical protein
MEALLYNASPLPLYIDLAKTASDHVMDHVHILYDLVLQALVIVLIFVLLGLTACATALILQAYWNHFVQVLYFDSKF